MDIRFRRFIVEEALDDFSALLLLRASGVGWISMPCEGV